MKIVNYFSFEHPLASQLTTCQEKLGYKTVDIYINRKSNLQLLLKISSSIIYSEHQVEAFHSMGNRNLILCIASSILNRNSKTKAVFWGSDFSCGSEKFRFKFFLLKIFVDNILFCNPAMKKKFAQQYGDSHKYKDVRFGLETLISIDKANRTKKNTRYFEVHIGSNSSTNQQFEKIIPELLKIDEFCNTNNIKFVFNLAYGDLKYRESIKKNLKASKLNNYSVTEDFKEGIELANYRSSASVFVNLQRHDMLSGAMQESLYAGIPVITGDWLDYSILEEAGARLVKIREFDELSDKVINIFDNYETHSCNFESKQAIKSLSSWEAVSTLWDKALSSEK